VLQVKGLAVTLSPLFATLAGRLVSVAGKGVRDEDAKR
jgi:hypothetical protein